MATVIDQLVVKLSLDDVEFQEGEKRVADSLEETEKKADETAKRVSESGKKGAEFFGHLEKAALKFFAVLTVGRGMADFTRTVIATGATFDRMSKNLGTGADTLSRWAGAVRQSGGTTEGFLGTMQGLSQSLTELKLTGNTGILPYLQALGVSVADTNGKAKPLEQILGDIGDKLNKLPNRQDAFNIGRSLGIDDGTINLLLKGRSEVEKLLASQKAYSQADAEAARKAEERWQGVKDRIEGISKALVIDLIPAFERLSDKMESVASVTVPVLSTIFVWLEKIDRMTGSWSEKLNDLIPKFDNPTLQGVASTITGQALRMTPVSRIAGFVDSKLDDEQRGNIERTKDKVLAFFGNQAAKDRLEANRYGMPDQAASIPAPGTGTTRAERNNNPGNLNYAGQTGAVLEDGSNARFAKFGSTAEGVSALAKQLQRYGERGLDTVSKIINKYAPSSENDTKAYVEALSKRLGVSGDQKLDLNDSSTLAGLIKGISRHEAGSDYLSDSDLMTGLSMAGVKGGGAQQAPNVSIGEVKVYTQATDANGIARDTRGAIIQQANTGVR